MKLIYLLMALMILLAAGASARGLEITQMRMGVEYNEAYTYQLEYKTRNTYAPAIANNSRINVDVFPGDNVTFTVRMENTLGGSGPENRLRNAYVKVTIIGIDGGSDMDESTDNFELEAGDDALVDLKFKLPLDAATGTYDVLVSAQADGRNGTFYFTENKLKLEVKKLGHDIRIVRWQLSPSIMDCSRKTKITAETMNLGSNDEGDLALEFKSNELGISSIDRFSLISSNDANDDEKIYTKILPIEIAQSTRAGIYPININLYWRGLALFDRKTLYLDLRNCGPVTNASQTGQNMDANNQNFQDATSGQVENSKNGGRGILPQGISISGSPALVWIVLGGFVVFVLVIVIIFGYVGRNKSGK